MNLLVIAWRNIGRNRRRSLLSLSAVALAVLAITFLFAYLEGMKADIASNLINHYTGEVRIRHEKYEDFERFNPLHLRVQDADKVIEILGSVEEVSAVSPRIDFSGAVFKDERSYGLRGLGIDFVLERDYQDLSHILFRGSLPDEVRVEGRRVPAVVGRGLADRMDLEPGDSFTLLATTMSRGNNAMTFQITGILDFPVGSLNGATFMAPLPAVQRLLRMDGSVTEVLVKGHKGFQPSETASSIAQALTAAPQREELIIQPWNEIESTYNWLETASVIYNFIALFFLILGSTVIINTVVMTVFERKREIGTLAALGMQQREIIRLFFFEAAIMSFVGSLFGVLLGIGIVLPLSRTGIDLTNAMEGVSFEISNVIYPELNLHSTLLVLIYSTFVASVASYIPVRGISKIAPVEALRAE
jgi:putative ABC transport system permease protein